MNFLQQEATAKSGDETYGFAFTTNALCILQEEMSPEAFNAFTSGASANIGMVEMRQVIWAALEGYRMKHKTRPDAFTLTEAGDIMDGIGGIEKVSEVFKNLFSNSMPEPKAEEDNVAAEGKDKG